MVSLHRAVCATLVLALAAAAAVSEGGGTLAAAPADFAEWSPDDLVHALLAPERLPEGFRASPHRSWCAASLTAAIREAWDDVSPGARRLLPHVEPDERARVPRGHLNQILDTEHFRIYYTLEGYDAIEYTRAESLAAELEQAYAVFRHDPRFLMRTPRGEGPVNDEGTARIVCFVFRLYDALGTAPIWETSDAECPAGGAGEIWITSDLDDEYEHSVSAHEVFHVFQAANRARYSEERFLYESGADWCIGHVWPQEKYALNRAGYLLRTPHLPFWDEGDNAYRIYGGSHFWDFLDQRFGPPAGGRWTAAQIWWRTCDEPWLAVLEDELAGRGVSMLDALHEFALWNSYTGTRDDGLHFAEGWRLPGAWHQHLIDEYPALHHVVHDESRARWAASNYLLLMGKADRRMLRFRLESHPEMVGNRRVTMIATTRPANHVQFETLTVDSDVSEYLVPDWHLYDLISVIVTNGPNVDDLSDEVLEYSFHAEEFGDSAIDVPWFSVPAGLRNAPDPFASATFVRFEVVDGVAPTKLFVVDVSGRRVATLVDERLASGWHNRDWSGRDAAGGVVASGVYYLVLENGPTRTVEKAVKVR